MKAFVWVLRLKGNGRRQIEGADVCARGHLTKATGRRRNPLRADRRDSRHSRIVASIDKSLRRLQTDSVDA